MSDILKPSSSFTSGGWRRRRGRRERGFPKICRCGEEVIIKTSGTSKNPGRLFHCCPYGSEEDKFHLFCWTDECMVEEIEDLKESVGVMNGEIKLLKGELSVLQEEVSLGKRRLNFDVTGNSCCAVM